MLVRYCVATVLSLTLSMACAEEPVFDDNGTPLYEVNFVDTELGEFIDSVSRITGTTFIVDPRVKGKVTVRTVDLHDADAIYDIFWPSCAPGLRHCRPAQRQREDRSRPGRSHGTRAGGGRRAAGGRQRQRGYSGIQCAQRRQRAGAGHSQASDRPSGRCDHTLPGGAPVGRYRLAQQLERIASLLRQLDRPGRHPATAVLRSSTCGMPMLAKWSRCCAGSARRHGAR